MRGVVKGTAFEIEVSIALSNIKGFVEIPNLLVYSHFLQRPTEIDRLLISPWGLISVEAKSFTHYLKGDYEDRNWYGVTGKTTTTIFNPVNQNYEHIRSLKNALFPILNDYVKIENYVVAPDSCHIQSNYPKAINLSNFVGELVKKTVGRPILQDLSEIARAIDRVRVV